MKGNKIYHVELLGDWELEDKKNQTVRKAIIKMVFGTEDSPSPLKELSGRQLNPPPPMSSVIIMKIIIERSLIELARPPPQKKNFIKA